MAFRVWYGDTPPEAPEAEDAPAPMARPAKSAYKDEWVDYAVSQGAGRESANDMTKNDLMAVFGVDAEPETPTDTTPDTEGQEDTTETLPEDAGDSPEADPPA